MDLGLEAALRQEASKNAVTDEIKERCRARAAQMLKDIAAKNPKQAQLILDPSPHCSGICPRRAGKSYAGAAAALITGEAKPGSISIIISLNLKQLRRLYWKGGASGLFTLAQKYNLNIKFNSGLLMWEHENGSIGYLLGVEDDEQLEVIRGLEADLYLIDECKSFAPTVLTTLIDEIIEPQRSSRDGKLILIGTPGYIFAGPFYQATCIDAKDPKDPEKKPYMLPYGKKDPWGRTPEADLLWSCHSWTLKENTAKPKQWDSALRLKRSKRWADDHPIWRREYLGEWTIGGSGLVYRYGAEKSSGRVNWTPVVILDPRDPEKHNPTGLPKEGAPWRLIAGLDLGYEAPTAFVIAAYSPKLKQLRHVHDEQHRHLLPPDIADMIETAQQKYGPLERIFADAGNLGKMIIAQLIRDYGLPIERAEKREKLDYIELVNGSLARGEIKIIENTQLEAQLLTNAWKLQDEDEDEILDLARRGKLKEDDAIPNDLADAFLYLYRGSLHHFGARDEEEKPQPGTPEAIVLELKEELAKARASFKNEERQFSRVMARAPRFAQRAMKFPWTIPSRPRHSTRSTSTSSKTS